MSWHQIIVVAAAIVIGLFAYGFLAGKMIRT
jgi:hypothetical protein